MDDESIVYAHMLVGPPDEYQDAAVRFLSAVGDIVELDPADRGILEEDIPSTPEARDATVAYLAELAMPLLERDYDRIPAYVAGALARASLETLTGVYQSDFWSVYEALNQSPDLFELFRLLRVNPLWGETGMTLEDYQRILEQMREVILHPDSRHSCPPQIVELMRAAGDRYCWLFWKAMMKGQTFDQYLSTKQELVWVTTPLGVPEEVLRLSTQELGLSTQVYNALRRSQILSVEQFLEVGLTDIMSLRNFKEDSLRRVVQAIDSKIHGEPWVMPKPWLVVVEPGSNCIVSEWFELPRSRPSKAWGL